MEALEIHNDEEYQNTAGKLVASGRIWWYKVPRRAGITSSSIKRQNGIITASSTMDTVAGCGVKCVPDDIPTDIGCK